MALEIKETFQVNAPIAAVWRFMMTPENVVDCMPGASLVEVIDEKSFVGNIKLKVGAVTANYQGTISFTEVDEAGHRIEMLAEAKEKGGGTVKATIQSSMKVLGPGETEVLCEANAELTGKIMQVGRGMIQGVSQQLFKKFVAKTKAQLEAPSLQPAAPGAASDAASAAPGSSLPAKREDDSIAVLPLLFQTFWSWLKGLFGGRS